MPPRTSAVPSSGTLVGPGDGIHWVPDGGSWLLSPFTGWQKPAHTTKNKTQNERVQYFSCRALFITLPSRVFFLFFFNIFIGV